jgi:23S rRNA (pseudouridine1915-N3)-methyltransferase
MKLRMVWFGKPAPRTLEPALADYQGRLAKQCRFEGIELAESRGPDALGRERDQALEKLAGFQLLSLCVEGKPWSTEQWARELETWRRDGTDVGLLIGSADGLHPDLVKAARWKVSLGPVTLPHTLARVILLEQLYRAHTILQGLPYHRA